MRIVETDILIIGSGAAGLTASVYAALSDVKVLVIDKGSIGRSGSTVGAVQIAGAGRWSSEEDSQEVYFNDVLRSGRGLSNPLLVDVLVKNIETIIDDLVQWGLKIDLEPEGNVRITSTSGHCYPRSISAKKGNSGLGILQTLARKANQMSNIQCWSDVVTIQLLTLENKVCGAVVYDLSKAEFCLIQSKAVILATGGGGQLYPVTSNPVQSTGDGFSLALQAGAVLIEMEQVQFYPVSLIYPESLRGFCMSFYHIARLMNSREERFMSHYEPENLENVTRDRLAYAMAYEIRAGRGTAGNGLWLDATASIDTVKQWFPHEYKLCLQQGVDLENDYAEVAPAAHFMMGGVEVDAFGASNVTGLYAAGETAGGLHGGNRLGNNALSECLVFGARAGQAAAGHVKNTAALSVDNLVKKMKLEEKFAKDVFPSLGKYRPYEIKDQIRMVLGEYAGVLRSREGLIKAQKELNKLAHKLLEARVVGSDSPFSRDVLDYIEAGHMLWAAKAIVGSAILREESRGAHNLLDFPERLSAAEHTIVKCETGQLIFNKRSIKNSKVGDVCFR